jgi:hypothetical protein
MEEPRQEADTNSNKLPKTPQDPALQLKNEPIKIDDEHAVVSDKKITLSDEDKALDSGI